MFFPLQLGPLYIEGRVLTNCVGQSHAYASLHQFPILILILEPRANSIHIGFAVIPIPKFPIVVVPLSNHVHLIIAIAYTGKKRDTNDADGTSDNRTYQTHDKNAPLPLRTYKKVLGRYRHD